MDTRYDADSLIRLFSSVLDHADIFDCCNKAKTEWLVGKHGIRAVQPIHPDALFFYQGRGSSLGCAPLPGGRPGADCTGVADEILNSEKSALLQYHLAGNPAKLDELNGLSRLNLAREIGRLEGRLYLPAARTATEASPPLSDVRDSAAPTFDPHTTDDMDAFASWLREDQARRRRA